jgi:hypothetical protein
MQNPLLFAFLECIVCYKISTCNHGVQEREACEVTLLTYIFSLLWLSPAFFDDLIEGCSQNLQV